MTCTNSRLHDKVFTTKDPQQGQAAKRAVMFKSVAHAAHAKMKDIFKSRQTKVRILSSEVIRQIGRQTQILGPATT